MSKPKLCLTVLAAIACPIAALAVDGINLINQSTVQAAGGFPYQITQPGSYRLSGNLISNGKTAISITAPNVMLDLNGFNVSCNGCSGVPGIVSSASLTTILNGTVSSFLGSTQAPYGIYFQGSEGKVDHVTVNANGTGINSDSGQDFTVTNSSALNNSSWGIVCGGTLTVVNSKVSWNAQSGISMVNGLVTGSTISSNGFGNSGGVRGGIGVWTSANITNNTIINNSVMGIFTFIGNTPVGSGLNTFIGQLPDMFGSVTSMKNNVCSNGVLC